MEESELYKRELEKAQQFRSEINAKEAEEEQARLEAEMEQQEEAKAANDAIPRNIFNGAMGLVMIICVIYLIVGAFLNARRETKGLPKKKRTSMIIFVLAIMAICYAVFFAVNPIPK